MSRWERDALPLSYNRTWKVVEGVGLGYVCGGRIPHLPPRWGGPILLDELVTYHTLVGRASADQTNATLLYRKMEVAIGFAPT